MEQEHKIDNNYLKIIQYYIMRSVCYSSAAAVDNHPFKTFPNSRARILVPLAFSCSPSLETYLYTVVTYSLNYSLLFVLFSQKVERN